VPLPAEALVFIGAIALLYFHLGARLQAAWGEWGLLASQWGLLALAALAFVGLGRYDARRTLALRRPAPRALLAAVLIALGGMPVGWLIGWVQVRLFAPDLQGLEALERLLSATDAQRAMWLVFVAALTPALCEELVFRGVLLQSLGRELRPWRAIVLSAAVFGAFHLSFETALRFLPTMWIGLLMATVVWHSRSIFASMVMHFVNNALVVLMLWSPRVRGLALDGQDPRWALVLAGAAVLAAGLWLLPRREAAGPVEGAPAGLPAPA